MIYFQGAKGSFSWLAAKEFFGLNEAFEAVPKFVDLFSKIEEMPESFAVLPVENSLAGSVIGNYDLLYKKNSWVCGEVYLNIQHCLLGTKDANINYIEQVYSHPTALQQCQNFFLSNPQIQAKEFSNTALAAEFVSTQNNPKYAAIASKESANFFDLKILQSNLEDDPNNWTRFLILKSRHNINSKFENVSKSSVAYGLKRDEAGGLFRSLEPLAKRKINLVNIESRPILGKPFEYIFYVDFEFSSEQILGVQEAFLEIKTLTQKMKILGVYPKSDILNF